MAIGSSQPYFWIRGLVTSDPHRESHRRQLVAAWLFFPCWGTCGIKTRSWDFFDSPVVKTPCFHCRGTGSIPGWGAKIPLTVSEVAQSCPTLCDSMDCSLPGSSVHGIFQAWILEWVAISFSKIQTQAKGSYILHHAVYVSPFRARIVCPVHLYIPTT